MVKKVLYKYINEINKICKENGIKKLMLFGSTLYDTATDNSDIDFLAEFKGEKSLFDIIKIKQELEDLLHNPVDLMTSQSLSPYFRSDVLNEAEIIYEDINN